MGWARQIVPAIFMARLTPSRKDVLLKFHTNFAYSFHFFFGLFEIPKFFQKVYVFDALLHNSMLTWSFSRNLYNLRSFWDTQCTAKCSCHSYEISTHGFSSLLSAFFCTFSVICAGRILYIDDYMILQGRQWWRCIVKISIGVASPSKWNVNLIYMLAAGFSRHLHSLERNFTWSLSLSASKSNNIRSYDVWYIMQCVDQLSTLISNKTRRINGWIWPIWTHHDMQLISFNLYHLFTSIYAALLVAHYAFPLKTYSG
jgi:hypothetical protein